MWLGRMGTWFGKLCYSLFIFGVMSADFTHICTLGWNWGIYVEAPWMSLHYYWQGLPFVMFLVDMYYFLSCVQLTHYFVLCIRLTGNILFVMCSVDRNYFVLCTELTGTTLNFCYVLGWPTLLLPYVWMTGSHFCDVFECDSVTISSYLLSLHSILYFWQWQTCDCSLF